MERRSQAGRVQSVERAFGLLEQIAESEQEPSLGELSTLVGLPSPTVHRLLRTMMTMGYVRQLPSRRYTLGLGLMRLGERADTRFAPLALPHLRALARRTGETADFAMLDGDRVVYLAQAPSPHSMRTFTEVGRRSFLHATGAGKAILAQLDAEAVRRVLAQTGMPRMTERTVTDPEELEVDLAAIRERGYALDDGESEAGVRCYAAAIPGLSVPAAFSLSGPAMRMTEAAGRAAIPVLSHAAITFSRQLRASTPL